MANDHGRPKDPFTKWDYINVRVCCMHCHAHRRVTVIKQSWWLDPTKDPAMTVSCDGCGRDLEVVAPSREGKIQSLLNDRVADTYADMRASLDRDLERIRHEYNGDDLFRRYFQVIDDFREAVREMLRSQRSIIKEEVARDVQPVEMLSCADSEDGAA